MLWDNRCLMHRATPHDPGQPRRMWHTRIAGDPATEAGLDHRPSPTQPSVRGSPPENARSAPPLDSDLQMNVGRRRARGSPAVQLIVSVREGCRGCGGRSAR